MSKLTNNYQISLKNFTVHEMRMYTVNVTNFILDTIHSLKINYQVVHRFIKNRKNQKL